MCVIHILILFVQDDDFHLKRNFRFSVNFERKMIDIFLLRNNFFNWNKLGRLYYNFRHCNWKWNFKIGRFQLQNVWEKNHPLVNVKHRTSEEGSLISLVFLPKRDDKHDNIQHWKSNTHTQKHIQINFQVIS